MTNHNHTPTEGAAADLRLSPPPSQEIFPHFSPHSPPNYHQNPRKKRTKLIRIDDPIGAAACSSSSGGGAPAKPKKPDPSAPKITRPCSECGKKFWSWKALFGHMRCHPERQWRGINPPPNFRRLETAVSGGDLGMTDEDHEIASCLLMLASGSSPKFGKQGIIITSPIAVSSTSPDYELLMNSDDLGRNKTGEIDIFRFECTSCKKVFGSHQALGGHRASHKNVKGCFAINRGTDTEEVADHINGEEREDLMRERDGEERTMVGLGHKCSICFRVFSSGQALGGHKRCHWEKGFEGLHCNLDLNLPAPVEDDNDSSLSCFSSGLALDLRLGI